MPKSQSLEAEYAKKEQQIYEDFEKLKIKDKQTYEKVEAKRVKAIQSQQAQKQSYILSSK